MKKLIPFIFLLLSALITVAQKKKPANTVPTTKAQLNKMMEDMLDQQNLSPAEKAQVKQMMKDAVKQTPAMANTAGGTPAKIIKKQTSRLAHIPRLANAAACQSYIQKLKDQASTSIQATIRQQVDQLISKYQSNTAAIINLGPALLLKKNRQGAIYAAIRATQVVQNNVTAKNNLGVILQQTGYPQHAIPVLEYLNTQNPQNPTILNNIGQCYLSLGDTEKAKTYFMGCLRIAPNHPEANCGTALILNKQGLIADAIPYIQKAMKNGYSEDLEEMIDANNIKLDFDAIKPTVPEYFNPQKYKPVPAAKKLADIGTISTQREEMHNLGEAWYARENQSSEAREQKIQGENLSQIASRVYGMVPNTPFGARARFMFLHASLAYAEWGGENVKNVETYRARAKEAYKKLDAQIDAMYKSGTAGSVYEACVKKKELLERYLAETSAIHEAYERATLHKHYDYVNEQLHWARFLVNNDEYKNLYYDIAEKFVHHLAEYDDYQILYPTPEFIMNDCENLLKNPPKEQTTDEAENAGCPIKLGAGIGAGSVKVDCEGYEIEGGEFLVGGFEKNMRNGDMTVAFGLGGSLEAVVVGFGAKGQMFFKVDKNFMPVDCGMRFETGVETNIGPAVLENKATLVMGLTSGASLDVVHNNQATNIFNLDPTK